MSKSILALLIVAVCLVLAGSSMAASVSMKLSGPGKVNDSTIKAGQKVSFDIYFENDKPRMGTSVGFKFVSPDKSIKVIKHPADSTGGLKPSKGDVKGYGVFKNKEVFQVLNQPILSDWNDTLPEKIGFMTMVIDSARSWGAQASDKVYSLDVIVPDAGLLVFDSAFFPPGGNWKFVSGPKQEDAPVWKGPYRLKVVK